MRVVVQRVKHAQVEVEGQKISSIRDGLLVLAAFKNDDTLESLRWMAGKLSRLRIFDDEQGAMNCSVLDVGGDIMVVSQFTLFAKVKKGNRPSYIESAKGEIAEPLFETFCREVEAAIGKPVARGSFGADMQVSLCNDGPVTILIDSEGDL